MAGIIGVSSYPTLWRIRASSSSPVVTPINVNSVSGPYAHLYIISFNWGDNDSTYYEFGIIRNGFNGNHITKTVLSERKRSDISFLFSYNEDGYITVVSTSTSSYPSINVRIFG